MAQRTREQTDFVPHLPELIVTMGQCWRAVRDAQTDVDPFGRSFDALGEVGAPLEALAYHCMGQRGLLVLVDDREPKGCAGRDRDVAPF